MNKLLIAGAVLLSLAGLVKAETVAITTLTVNGEKYVSIEVTEIDPAGTKYLKREPELIKAVDYLSRVDNEIRNTDSQIARINADKENLVKKNGVNSEFKQKALDFLADN